MRSLTRAWLWIAGYLICVIVALSLVHDATAKGLPNESKWQHLVVRCEAKGLPHPWQANTGNGFYGGPQFDRSTWFTYLRRPKRRHKYPTANLAPRWLQILVAEKVRKNQGMKAWPSCRGYWR